MKKHLLILTSIIACTALLPAQGQPRRGGMGMGGSPGPAWDGAMAKIFGNNPGFTATMEFETTRPSGDPIKMTMKTAHLKGKVRSEMDMSSMPLPPQALEHMKEVGMTHMVNISRHDLNKVYMMYPDIKAYVENPFPQTKASSTNLDDYKLDITKLGEETVDGHPSIKSKFVVTGPDATPHEFTVWQASDLDKFPVKLEFTSQNGNEMSMLFKDIKMEKPDASLFEPPADYKKYDSMMSLMMSGAAGAPPR